MLQAYSLVLLVSAVLSWVPSLRGRWSIVVDRLTEPVLQPLNRIIPPIGGLSIAFMLLIFATQWLAGRFMMLGASCRMHLGG